MNKCYKYREKKSEFLFFSDKTSRDLWTFFILLIEYFCSTCSKRVYIFSLQCAEHNHIKYGQTYFNYQSTLPFSYCVCIVATYHLLYISMSSLTRLLRRASMTRGFSTESLEQWPSLPSSPSPHENTRPSTVRAIACYTSKSIEKKLYAVRCLNILCRLN